MQQHHITNPPTRIPQHRFMFFLTQSIPHHFTLTKIIV